MTTTKKLQKILKSTDNELTKYVIDDILDGRDNNEAEGYIKDVMRGGCQSGTVSDLIYYTDTKAFYIKYMDEIHELYNDTVEQIGDNVEIDTNHIANWFAWFGYEQTLFNITNEIKLDY